MATDHTTTGTSTAQAAGHGPAVGRHRALPVATVAGATVVATLPWLLARATGTELAVTPPGQPEMVVGLPHVVTTALLASIAGWGAATMLRRVTSRARPAWTWLAVAVLLLSFVPVVAAETSAAARLVLAAMHLAVALVLIPGLRASLPTTRGRGHE